MYKCITSVSDTVTSQTEILAACAFPKFPTSCTLYEGGGKRVCKERGSPLSSQRQEHNAALYARTETKIKNCAHT